MKIEIIKEIIKDKQKEQTVLELNERFARRKLIMGNNIQMWENAIQAAERGQKANKEVIDFYNEVLNEVE